MRTRIRSGSVPQEPAALAVRSGSRARRSATRPSSREQPQWQRASRTRSGRRRRRRRARRSPSLILGIVGLLFCPYIFSVLGLVFGYMARGEIKRSGGALGGEGLALAGIIISWGGARRLDAVLPRGRRGSRPRSSRAARARRPTPSRRAPRRARPRPAAAGPASAAGQQDQRARDDQQRGDDDPDRVVARETHVPARGERERPRRTAQRTGQAGQLAERADQPGVAVGGHDRSRGERGAAEREQA